MTRQRQPGKPWVSGTSRAVVSYRWVSSGARRVVHPYRILELFAPSIRTVFGDLHPPTCSAPSPALLLQFTAPSALLSPASSAAVVVDALLASFPPLVARGHGREKGTDLPCPGIFPGLLGSNINSLRKRSDVVIFKANFNRGNSMASQPNAPSGKTAAQPERGVD